jgi:KH domain
MIGRQGIVIKSMSEQSNCQMQLAEMNDPYDTKERIMVINGKNGQIKDLIQVSAREYHTKCLMTYD